MSTEMTAVQLIFDVFTTNQILRNNRRFLKKRNKSKLVRIWEEIGKNLRNLLNIEKSAETAWNYSTND